MELPVLIIIVSFLCMAALVLQNVRHIKRGDVHKLHPINLYDLIRPTFEVWKSTVRGFGHLLWATVLKWFHILSFKMGTKFLEIAWLVKGKRKLMREEGTATRIWKEVAYEKERIKAHFQRSHAR